MTEQYFAEFLAKYKVKAAVETGTFYGSGTTTRLWRAARKVAPSATITTIECNKKYFNDARTYFAKAGLTTHLQPLLGVTVPKFMLLSLAEIEAQFVRRESEFGELGAPLDHAPENRVKAYFKESHAPDVEHGVLDKVIQASSTPIGLFVLDSAGHLGRVEFHYLLGLALQFPAKFSRPFCIMLDGTSHCKHLRSLQFVKKQPGWKVLRESTDRFGWAAVEVMLPA